MRKPLVLTAMLFFVIVATALTYSDLGPTGTSAQQPAKADNPLDKDKPVKVQGCVSAANGMFSLTDGSGTVYRLAGDASKFPEHNGHKVEITGTITPPTSGQADSQPTLTVASIELVASSCTASQ
jgi:hypothetical protein